MLSVSRFAVLCALLALASTAGAQSNEDPASDGVPRPAARSERLDIYGAGMCHTCEWRPRATVKPAADQCGTGSDGSVNVGVYECGRNPQCEPTCNFVRCGAL